MNKQLNSTDLDRAIAAAAELRELGRAKCQLAKDLKAYQHEAASTKRELERKHADIQVELQQLVLDLDVPVRVALEHKLVYIAL